jgi:hypothetical protein
VGLDLPFFHFHVRPEFRYSHWFSPSVPAATPFYGVLDFITVEPLSVPAGSAFPTFRTFKQNEAAILLGLTY